ncbi:MAG TPA: FxDxF family PEP-CTERM protein [Methylophilaceae bacterium]|jgi:hypothetical protein
MVRANLLAITSTIVILFATSAKADVTYSYTSGGLVSTIALGPEAQSNAIDHFTLSITLNNNSDGSKSFSDILGWSVSDGKYSFNSDLVATPPEYSFLADNLTLVISNGVINTYDLDFSYSNTGITHLVQAHGNNGVGTGYVNLFLNSNSGQTSILNSYSTGTWVTQAVPETETFAMLLAGLGVIGFIARRKQK